MIILEYIYIYIYIYMYNLCIFGYITELGIIIIIIITIIIKQRLKSTLSVEKHDMIYCDSTVV